METCLSGFFLAALRSYLFFILTILADILSAESDPER